MCQSSLVRMVLFPLLAIITAVKANTREVEKKILDDILGSKAYDPRIRPSGHNSTGKFRREGMMYNLLFLVQLK